MRIFHLILISMLMPVNAFGQYIVYNEADGKIIGTTPSPALEKGQTALLYDGAQFDLRAKKIVNGAIVDNEEYGRKIEVSGDTEVTAAPNATVNLTLKLVDRNGTVITNMDRDIKLKVTRGKLTKKKVTTVSGVLTLTVKGVDETIDIELTATDPDGVFQTARHTISLIP